MTPRFERKEAFTVIGMGKDLNPGEPQTFAALWEAFLQRLGEIKPAGPDESYGVCRPATGAGAQPGWLHYIAALCVADDASLPDGMEKVLVAAQEYAVFTYKGPSSGMPGAYEYIFKTWLPQSGMIPAESPLLEVYGTAWKSCGSPDSSMEICLPLKRAR